MIFTYYDDGRLTHVVCRTVHHSNAGIIAGAIVGSLALVALIVAGILLFLRRRRRQFERPDSPLTEETIEGPARVIEPFRDRVPPHPPSTSSK